MKAKLISAWKTITAFVKRNAFSCACFLLALLVFVTGLVSYAKYVTGSSGGGGASAGTFSVSATIDSVSALSFTNTSFWGSGTDEEADKVQMNVLRSVNFSVRNYNEDNATNVSATRLKYNLAFSTPKNFAEKLVLQVFDESNQPMLPQIVIADLINAVGAGTSGTYNTNDSNNYSGMSCTELTFDVTKSGDDYVATSGNTVIQLQKVIKTMEQSLMFRMWDTSKLTSESNPTIDVEGGQLQTPLTVTYKMDVDCYRIVVTMGEFVLPAGERKEVTHSIRLAPTDSINDDYIGSTIVEKKDDGTYQPITQIYADNGKTYYLQNVWETATDTYCTDDTYNTVDSGKPSTSSTTNVSHLIDYKEGDTSTTTTKTNEQVNETEDYGSSPHTYTTTTTTESEKTEWSDWEITGTEPTKENIKKSSTTYTYIGQTTRGWQTALSWGGSITQENQTKFYIHKLSGTRTCTSTVTKVEEQRTIASKTTTDRSTEVEDVQTVTEVVSNDNSETITMNVVRTTTVTDIGSEHVQTITTTTTTYTRTYTQTGTFYRAYYEKSGITYGDNDILDHFTGTDLIPIGGIPSDGVLRYISTGTTDKNKEYEGCIIDKDTNFLKDANGNPTKDPDKVVDKDSMVRTFSPETLIEQTDITHTDTQTNSTATTESLKKELSFTTTSTNIEYLTREIKRKYTYTEITPTNVNWCKLTEDRELVTDENGTVMTDYTQSSLLEFYYKNENGTQIQYLYLAQCYSKEYPFFVDVVFEQIQ